MNKAQKIVGRFVYKGDDRTELYKEFGHSYVSSVLKSISHYFVEVQSIVKCDITIEQALQAHRITNHNAFVESVHPEFAHLFSTTTNVRGATLDFIKHDTYGTTIFVGGNPIIFRYEIDDEQRFWVLGFVWRALTDCQNLWEIPIQQ